MFDRTKELISEIDSFWDTIGKAALVFRAGAEEYFTNKLDRLKYHIAYPTYSSLGNGLGFPNIRKK